MKNFTHMLKRIVIPGALLVLPAAPLWAAEANTPDAAGSDLLLWAMTGMVIVLGLVIVALALLLRTSLQLTSGGKKAVSRIIPVIMFIVCMTGTSDLSAQTRATSFQTGMHPFLFAGFIVIIVFLLVIIGLLYRAIMMVLKPVQEKEKTEKAPGFLEKLNASVPLARENDVMLDHNYDGIRELDNNLPPWWKYGFYFTIVFALIYLWRFHGNGNGKLQLAEYEEQLVTAEAEVAAYKERVGNLVDENNVVAFTEASAIANGRSLFTANCAACHGQLGEGGVGPNLTDEYWIHGGSVKDIFKSVKYGWPQKGMKSWEKDLGAKQIQELTSYIVTLKGTNPPNAKEKQGDLYEDAPPAPSDSIPRVTALK